MYAATLQEGSRLYSWLLLGGRVPVLVDEKQPLYSELERQNLVLKREFQARRFDLAVPADLSAYQQTMERIVAGWYVQLVKKDLATKDNSMPVYWLEWVVQYYTRTA